MMPGTTVITQLAAPIASNAVRVVDLTQTLRPSTPVINLVRQSPAIKAEANNGAFYVSVRDIGPGIFAADQAKLFQDSSRPTMRLDTASPNPVAEQGSDCALKSLMASKSLFGHHL
jgi:hypothetical protein